MKMRDFLRLLGVLVLVVGMCGAQVGPPVCVVPGARLGGAQVQPVRPTAAAIRATAEEEAADPTVLLAAEPLPNFGVERFRLEDYAECVGESGCYWADLDAQWVRAEAALDRVLAARKEGEKLALVLDIDETSLTNYCEIKHEDYGYIGPMFNEWLVSPASAMVIPGALRLYNRARAAGVEVFFITGRPEEQRQATESNLATAGYKGWKGLALRKGPQKTMPTIDYKSEERQKIVADGYRIVMSVGDQWSDLKGTAKAEISVKLPNPFYYLP
jgi:phosphoglycolate phosphatase-like HAD superfamily hydrolase